MRVLRTPRRVWALFHRAVHRQPLQLRALLLCAVAASLWLIGAGLWHTSSALGAAYTDLFCDAASVPAQPWLAEAQQEYDALLQGLLSVRQQSDVLLEAANASATAAAAVAAAELEEGAEPPPRWRLTAHPNGTGGDATAPFLFIGVLSVPKSRVRRQAVRDTWMREAGADVAVRFMLYEEEADEATLEELEHYGDLVFVPGGAATDYRSIVYKTFALVQWVACHSAPKFVLKTDDDAYVHTSNLVAALRKRCRDARCDGERLYMGAEKRNGVVITEEGNKWSNLEYFHLTGIREYEPYMFGGGYVYSADVGRALYDVNAIAPLRFMPNEDATFGFWVMGMDLRHIDEPKMRTAAGHCCFYALPDRDAAGRSAHARVRTLESLCADWLVLHKVDGSDQMRYLHHRMLQCPTDERILAAARQEASDRQLASAPAMHVRPLQMYAMTNWRRGFHFFGRNDVEAWSSDGSRLLRCRTEQLPHDVSPTDKLLLGYIPFAEGAPLTMEHSGWGWRPLAASRAWNYRLGARAQWLGASRSRVIYNDRACAANNTGDSLCSVLFDADKGAKVRVLPRPIYATSPDGSVATSLSFERLHVAEPGWGYPVGGEALQAATAARHPADDGLWLMDTRSGASRLLVSLRQLFDVTFLGRFSWQQDAATGLRYGTTVQRGGKAAAQCLGWIASAVFSQEGDAVAFLYRVGRCISGSAAAAPPLTFVYTVDVDGGNLWRVPVVQGDSMDFGYDGKLLVCDSSGTFLVQNRKGVLELEKPQAIAKEGPGPCRLFGDANRWVLGDTYHTPHKLYAWDLYTSEVYTLAILAPADWPGPSHALATLNPQWSPDGQVVALDSSCTWETGMQTYVVGVQHLQAGPPRPPPPPYVRHLYCDLAVRSGAMMAHFVRGEVDPWRWEVHAFQAGNSNLPSQQAAALARNVEAIARIAGNVTLHPEAVGTENGSAVINVHGVSKFDVGISDIQTLILPRQGAPARYHSWWRQQLAGCGARRGCSGAAGGGAGADPELAGAQAAMEVLDFPAWLAGQVAERDHVVLALALGEGRDFALLCGLLEAGALPLVDKVYVRWRYQLATWHQLALWEFVFSLLKIPFEYTDLD